MTAIETSTTPRKTAPAVLRAGAVVGLLVAVMSIGAAVAVAFDIGPAHSARAAARARTTGDVVVGVVMALLEAGLLAFGAFLVQRRDGRARSALMYGASLTIGSSLFWLLVQQKLSTLLWAIGFAVPALAVLVAVFVAPATRWFGAEYTAPSPRVSRLRLWWNALPRAQQWLWSLIAVAIAVVLPFIGTGVPLLGLINSEPGFDFPIALFDASYYALIALGLNVVIGQAGLLDLGYVGFFAIGAYVVALLTSSDSSIRAFSHTPWAWIICVPVAMAITMLSGLVLGAPTLRLRGDYLAIVTLGFGEIVRLLADNLPGLRGNVGFQNLAQPPGHHSDGTAIFSQTDGKPWYWLTIGLIIVVLLLVGNLERSRVGRAWVAIREDEDAAEIMGVPTFKFKLWAFVIGAAIGGLSGTLFAGQIGFVNNQKFDPATSILFVAAVVLGGAGNKVGVMLGAFLVSFIPYRFNSIYNEKGLIFGIALIALMLFRTQGLLGARQRLLTYGRSAYHRITGGPEALDTGKGAFATDVTKSSIGEA